MTITPVLRASKCVETWNSERDGIIRALGAIDGGGASTALGDLTVELVEKMTLQNVILSYCGLLAKYLAAWRFAEHDEKIDLDSAVSSAVDHIREASSLLQEGRITPSDATVESLVRILDGAWKMHPLEVGDLIWSFPTTLSAALTKATP